MAQIVIDIPDASLDDYYCAAIELRYARSADSALAEAQATGMDKAPFIQSVVVDQMNSIYTTYLVRQAQEAAAQNVELGPMVTAP